MIRRAIKGILATVCLITGITGAMAQNQSDAEAVKKKPSGYMAGEMWVDLGLPSGTLWCNKNLEAEKAYESGGFFVWGKLNNARNSVNGYEYESVEELKKVTPTYNRNIGDISHDLGYDAAAKLMGKTWRIPTTAEAKELLEYCKWEWVRALTDDGEIYMGYKVTGPSGQSIFFPAAGSLGEFGVWYYDEEGTYWTSTPKNATEAWMIGLVGEYTDEMDGDYVNTPSQKIVPSMKYYGHSIRAVTSPLGLLSVHSNLSGANVLIDGQYVGTTPLRNHELRAGIHNVTITRPGFKDYERKTEVNVGGWSRVSGVLTKIGSDGTVEFDPKEYEWIDLGLPSGLKWASCNIGAKHPEDTGEYFSWGATAPNEDDDYTISGYFSNGLPDDISGDEIYDAANVNWGDSARIPTAYEIKELFDLCVYEKTSVEGIDAAKLTGPNGNFIILPYSGRKIGLKSENNGVAAYFWSATLDLDTDGKAYGGILKKDVDKPSFGLYYIYAGLPIRAVCGEKKEKSEQQ